jgi:hypothetical protein
MTDRRCPLADLADTTALTDFDFRVNAIVVSFLLFEVTFDEIELTTTRHVYLAHAEELTFIVINDFAPTRLLVTFGAFLADTLN